MKNWIKKVFSENKFIFAMLVATLGYVFILEYFFNITPLPLEIIAIVFAIIEFDLFRREKSSAFIFNIIKCILMAIWFLGIGLYGQVAFRILFVFLNLLGLMVWLFPKTLLNKKTFHPEFLSRKIQILITIAIIIFMSAMFIFADKITAMDWIYVFIATIGNLFIVIKKTDAWILWLVADLIGLPLFFITGSWMFLLLSIFMIIIELNAWRQWGTKK